MSKHGHSLVALSLGVVVLATHPTLTGAETAAGIIFGASAPDWTEIVSWGPFGGRESVLEHRTVTHWPPVWVAVALGSACVPEPWSHIVFGFALGALLHIAVDLGSPMGVPLLNPFRRVRLPFAVYRTGQPSEILVIAPALAAAALAIVTHPVVLHVVRRLI